MSLLPGYLPAVLPACAAAAPAPQSPFPAAGLASGGCKRPDIPYPAAQKAAHGSHPLPAFCHFPSASLYQMGGEMQREKTANGFYSVCGLSPIRLLYLNPDGQLHTVPETQ